MMNLCSEEFNWFLGPTPASGGNPPFQKMNFDFLKITKFFLIFFASVLGSGRPNWFLGPTPASDGNPSFQKMNFYFLKIMKFLYFFFASVLDLGKPNWFLGPTPASDGNPSFQKMNFYFLKITKFFQIFSLRFWVQEGQIDFWPQPQPVMATLPSKKWIFIF